MNVWLIAAMTADGKIAQNPGQSSLDWTSPEDTRFFIEKTKEAGVVIMGSKTFETIGKPLKGRRVIVLTMETPLPATIFESANFSTFDNERKGRGGFVEFMNLSPADLVKKLVSEGVKSVVIAGGSSVYSQFLREGFVTDIYLTIEPYLFGNGLPLATAFDRIDLKLEEATRVGSQTVLLHYKIK